MIAAPLLFMNYIALMDDGVIYQRKGELNVTFIPRDTHLSTQLLWDTVYETALIASVLFAYIYHQKYLVIFSIRRTKSKNISIHRLSS